MTDHDATTPASRSARIALAEAGGLVDRRAIASRLSGGLTVQRVLMLTDQDGFPSPVARFARMPIWIADDVAAWAEANGRPWNAG